jgi:hypothetical protein
MNGDGGLAPLIRALTADPGSRSRAEGANLVSIAAIVAPW